MNILLIVVDTLRPDHLGAYGYDRPTSPHLDELSREGITLENLWSASNFTAPAFTSLFTGTYPHQHGVFNFTQKAPSSPIYDVLVTNRAQMGGIVTFRFFKNLLSNIWGEIEPVTDTISGDYAIDLPSAVTTAALAWLENTDNDKPFCLFTHYDGPHLPIRLPAPFSESFAEIPSSDIRPDLVKIFYPQDSADISQFGAAEEASMFQVLEKIAWGTEKLRPHELQWLVDRYDAAIQYNDQAIGDLLQGLEDQGRAENTLVVVLSDHGEEFLEHGAISHGGIHMHEEVIRTVGIMRGPGLSRGLRLPGPLSQVDALPNLLRLAGAEGINGLQEVHPFPDWFDQDPTGQQDPIFCHGKSKIAVRRGDWKMIKTQPSPALGFTPKLRMLLKMALRRELGSELYRLSQDPGEMTNLIRNRSEKKELSTLIQTHLKTRRVSLGPVQADEDEKKRIEQEMKDLGYM